MRALIQRVKRASVTVNGVIHSEIGKGLLVFLGVANTDTPEAAQYLAQRSASLRIFEDDREKMNLSVKDADGSALVVSQFTLYADTRKGNRPSFVDAANPELAEKLYHEFIRSLSVELGETKVCAGVFRAMMDISLINDGPVTIMLESKNHVS
ncbi:MAG: D-tyrosyl-tRNA(Tyr) deacylase [Ignavibacteriae bacterium]|nr:D-tyrosyl-tRNA(Tyr) deacylase [Ignavibacteria bacterium]MBI3365314.1 D-tyrosyl-tRNA(Tyr) deacylase [Ignavibacteriota bacterium]